MKSPPSVLVLDDGQLGRVRKVLAKLRVDFEHRTGQQRADSFYRPRHLLITSAQRAQEMGGLEVLDDSCEPIWVCAHNQDFLPLRERLRALGVHYLIHSELNPEVMELFFAQLLHRGRERRTNPRLHVNCELGYQLGGHCGKGRLQELSPGRCRFVTDEDIPLDTHGTVYLPPELAHGRQLALTGRVTHSEPGAERVEPGLFSLIVVLEDLNPGAQRLLREILEGRNIGTRITQLVPLPDRREAEPIGDVHERGEQRGPVELELTDEDRRADLRREYPRKLTAFRTDGTEVLFCRDLSLTGIRVDPHPSLSVGTHVSLALYGSRREESLIVDAEVVREDPAGGFGLRFDTLEPDERDWLKNLLAQLPLIESLAEPEQIVISRIVRSDDQTR